MDSLSPKSARTAAVAFALAALGVNLAAQMIFFTRVGRADWDQFVTFHLIQFWNHHYFGFTKGWNPLLGGGMSLGGDPQVPVMSLTMLIGYLAGPLAGVRLGTMAWSLIGFAGAYLYAGNYLREKPVRLLAAGLFVGNGFFITHVGNGHVCHLPALGAPLFLAAIHYAYNYIERAPSITGKALTAAAAGLALVPLAVISIDGSPVFPAYFFPWLAAYFAVYGWQKRSLWPLVILGLAIGGALVVDAVYALPLYGYQRDFPRAGLAKFHNPLALFIFIAVPLTGTPGPALGFPDSAQEYSLYIGPVLIYLLYRYRARLAGLGTTADRRRWLVLAAFFFVIGLGSLRSSGISWLFSPFDLLALLPGFRSVGSTSRYWGILIIPLSLGCAQAVWWLLNEETNARRRMAVLVLLFLFQFGFQAAVLVDNLNDRVGLKKQDLADYAYQTRDNLDAPGVVINHKITGKKFRMASRLTPATDIIDCYQNMEYPQGRIEPGDNMVINDSEAALEARWLSFNRFRISRRAAGALPMPDDSGRVLLVLNQNYYDHWSASHGEVVRTDSGNLGLRISPADLAGPVTLTYEDPWAQAGRAITRVALPVYAFLLAASAVFLVRLKMKTANNAAASPDHTSHPQ